MTQAGMPKDGDYWSADEIKLQLANDGDMEAALRRVAYGLHYIFSNQGSSSEFKCLAFLEDELKLDQALLERDKKLESDPEPEAPSAPLSGAFAPVKWLWGPADLGWLYEALTRKRAIDCSQAAFAALFTRIDGGPVTKELENAYKGQEPRRQGMKDMRAAISRHVPENDRR